MDCPEAERGEVAVACPPDDSLVEIFSRLHAKPLFRFKCVSKDWCGLIADRLSCRKFSQTLDGFLASDAAQSYGRFFGPPRPVPLVDPSFSFLTKSPEIKKIVLLGSCRHMQVSDTNDSLGYIVCNPATEEWVSVPSSGDRDSDGEDKHEEDDGNHEGDVFTMTLLIFDPAISPHFQLIKFSLFDGLFLQEVHTFSSVTGAWRLELDGLQDLTRRLTMVGPSASVGCPFNGMLHVCVDLFHFPKGNQYKILAIGGEERPFRTLHWPKTDRGSIVFIGQSQGHLHCLSGGMGKDSPIMTELSIWVLEDYNAEKWVLSDNVSLSQLFGRMSGSIHVEWDVVGIHPDRGVVFFADYWNSKLILYDMDKKEVHALCSLDGYRWRILPYGPYFAQSVALSKKH